MFPKNPAKLLFPETERRKLQNVPVESRNIVICNLEIV